MNPVFGKKKTVAERGDIRPLLNSCGTAPHGIATVTYSTGIESQSPCQTDVSPKSAFSHPEMRFGAGGHSENIRAGVELSAAMRKNPQLAWLAGSGARSEGRADRPQNGLSGMVPARLEARWEIPAWHLRASTDRGRRLPSLTFIPTHFPMTWPRGPFRRSSRLPYGFHARRRTTARWRGCCRAWTGPGSAGIICGVATRPEQTTKITDWSASVASERLVPFASVHPEFPDPEAEIDRIARAGLKGLKFHSYYMECPLDDPRCIRIARAAAAANLAMVFHTGYDLGFEKADVASPERVRRLHEAVPNLRMAAAHLGGWEQWDESRRHVVGLPIYLETSFSLSRCRRDLLLDILASHPPEYLLFGTDAPWTDQKEAVERLAALPVAEDLKRRLWHNAHRFANLPLPGSR